jgi:hypothetical protein
MRALSTLAGLALTAGTAFAQATAPGPGVPLEIAARRAATISGLRYELSLSIPDSLGSPLTGIIVVRFQLKEASSPLVFDFETSREHVKSVETNGKPAAFDYLNGHIVVPAESLAQLAPTRSASHSTPATPRSTAAPTFSTPSSFPRGRGWPSRCSISPI